MSVDHLPDEEPQAPAITVNPGEILRAEREAQNLSIAQVAEGLRLSRRMVEHLEAGEFDRLPGDTFSRGYVRAYARLLLLDPARLVQEFDRFRGIKTRERQVSGIGRVHHPPRATRQLMRWSSIVIVLVLLVLALLWWQEKRNLAPPAPVSELPERLIEEVQVDAMTLPEAVSPVRSPAIELLERDAAGQAASNSADAEVLATEPASDAEPAINAPAEVEPVAAANGLRMRFRDSCWLQVSAPGGQVLHSALMQAGQSLELAHSGPLDLVIGAVNAVESIEFQGQPVDLSATSQSGVARLRLGQ